MSKVEIIGRIIRDTRKSQKLTQEQLAAVSGLGIRFIRELEHGKASCQFGKALHVLAMLGIEVTIDGKSL